MHRSGVERRLGRRLWWSRLPGGRGRRFFAAAALVGAAGALAAMAFRQVDASLQQWWLGDAEDAAVAAAALSPLRRVATAALGGVAAGLALHAGRRWVSRAPSVDYMEAVTLGDGVIRLRPTLTRALSSLFTIASGGSIGREGAMVQLSAAVGSAAGRLAGLPAPRLRLLVACASAGGIAAVYNAPIAGALFVAEILLGSIAMESFGPIAVAAVAGAMTARYWGGQKSYFTAQNFKLAGAWEIGPCLALATVMGLAAPWLARSLEFSTRHFARLIPRALPRLAAGGLITGLISCWQPAVRGNGQAVVDLVLRGEWTGGGLAALLAAKLAATLATVASGAVGGIFTPTLLLGAMAGSAFGGALQSVAPHASNPAAYALVAMGALIAGTTRAPLMSMLMLFEMTLDYDVVLPVMLGCVAADAAAALSGGKSIYASSLLSATRPRGAAAPGAMPLEPLLRPAPPTVGPEAPFSDLVRRFLASRRNNLFVVDADGRLTGVIALHDIKDHLHDPTLAALVTAGELARPVSAAARGMTLAQTAAVLGAYEGEHIPVVASSTDARLVGEVAKTDVLLTMAHGPGVTPTMPGPAS